MATAVSATVKGAGNVARKTSLAELPLTLETNWICNSLDEGSIVQVFCAVDVNPSFRKQTTADLPMDKEISNVATLFRQFCALF